MSSALQTPDLDVAEPFLRDLVFPDRPLWTPTQLRDLTAALAGTYAERPAPPDPSTPSRSAGGRGWP